MKWLLAVLSLTCCLSAASLRVVVKDPSGAFIQRATVRAGEIVLQTSDNGEVVFPDLAGGRVDVTIQAEGFEPYQTSLTLKTGRVSLERSLKMATRRDSLEVGLDPKEERTDSRGSGFLASSLSEREIEQLPDDQDEMERVLRDMAGPGAVFRVDGFRGGRLPPKSQIQSIRFRLTPYSAEEHDDGFMLVDIVTKPGLGEWHGNLSFAFGDDSFNARNAFAQRREPQQSRRVDLSLTGPLRKNKTSLSLNFTRNDGYDSRTSIGLLPEGPFSNLIRLPQLATNGGARVNHGLTRSQVIRGEYQYDRSKRNSIGLFDLPERRSSIFSESHLLRLSGQGSISERLANEYRLQVQWSDSGNGSLTQAPTIQVQGAFTSGGANVDSDRHSRSLELSDHLAFNKGKHALRTGFQVDRFAYEGRDFTNGLGTTVYPNLQAYLNNQPVLYSRRSREVTVGYNQLRIGAYFHDDIRLKKSFSLSLGMRLEGMSQIRDRWNPAPRVGFAWAPFKHAKTTFRGGAGIFYEWYEANTYESVLRLNGASQVDLISSPLGVQLPGILRSAPDLRLPYVIRASAGIQQPLPGRINLFVDYRYERGMQLFRSRNVNTPGSGYGYLLELESGARSRNDAIVIGLGSPPSPDAKGLRARLFWNVFYALSRARDEVSSPLTPPANSFDARADWGPSAGDIRHRFNAMLQGTLGRGFQLGTFINAQSAAPYNVTTGFDNNQDTFFNDRPAGYLRNSGRGAGVLNVSSRLSWGFGIGKRNSAGGGMPQMVRLRVGDGIPDLPMGRAGAANALIRGQIYLQATNAINHVNPTSYIGVITSPFFGQPTAASAPRRMEIGLRFSF